ncbi:MAG: 3-deoxy-D-manno-octulosonate 8-phosphate phosphatase [Candidatus Buchananbacteria bacterium CG10_big_fil_rev_8_21_14_0_10_42_9]|uniref:3-deoxy-D-manno-octulosonate 8-phosphate phosphatase n=1 Tax=Candidatus Buchananbacteria bacterium CG10_big_fil_rev_8_21_14_0_10_42_9 TaxID=1974526 RepID=A0A2H0W1R6_9BACT|nr:MAG: 3-deoxy-D-manno-octulosonate 8-phosphate phosphatase [Candidatus Buchananbacteria bacterium CG10_big_fil_rev_8_21_14_0_10_42_9]
MEPEIKDKLLRIKLLALDFDGIFTDGYVYVDQDGKESVRASRIDGMGIELLKKAGIEIIVLSKEENPVVSARCKKLGINCWQGIHNSEGKLDILRRIMKEKDLSSDEVIYMGDDVNDIKVFPAVGLAITVFDAPEVVKKSCQYITKRKRGEHVVREVADLILSAQNKPLTY